MIKVFNAEEKSFSSNGEKVLQPLKAVILKEDNGDYELELETRIEDKNYIVNDKIIVCDTPWGKQGFRVYNPQKKSSKITCTCKHLFYDSANYLIADSNVVGKTCADALNHLNAACDSVTPFTTSSDIKTVNSFRCVRKSLEEAINVVLERWKDENGESGHLVRDNFNIEIRKSIGQDNGVTLRYGKNIQNIQVKEDWSKIVTKLLPVGKDGLTLEDLYVTTSDLSSSEPNYRLRYDKPYTKTVSFTQDLPEDEYKVDGKLDEDAYKAALLQDLKTQAIAYIKENCVPKINYSVKADIENVTDVGDTIEVYDERLNVNLMTNVISVKWDCIQGRYTEVNFGNFSNKLKNLITETTTATKNEVKNTLTNEVIPNVDDKVQAAYAEIWDMLDNSYCIYDGDQILIVDALPKETARNCIRFNRAGMAFGKNGITGAFTTVWAIDGTLNMQAVNVINLVADMIKVGTLKLGNVLGQNGNLELYDEASKLIGQMNAAGLTMYANDGGYIKLNNTVGFAAYDKNDEKNFWSDGGVFYAKKLAASDDITVGGKLRILPIKTSTNEGIGFVAVGASD